MAKHAVSAPSSPSPERPTGEAACPDDLGLRTEEAKLIARAQKRLPQKLVSRYKTLSRKRDAESLADSEYTELLSLSDQMELFTVQRLEALAQLAQLRGLGLKAMMKELDLQPPLDV